MKTHRREVETGKRFEFGRNWQNFLALIDEPRIRGAEQALLGSLGRKRLDGLTFLDIGSGSGLSSLVARRLGARVHSFDYDPQSVACTRQLRERFFSNDPDWTVEAGSALDADYLRSLPKFDIVYSWGVLHHTGAMWQGLDNALIPLAPGGQLVVAIYNYQPGWTSFFKLIKRTYVAAPQVGKYGILAAYAAAVGVVRFYRDLFSLRAPWQRYRKECQVGRGMSQWYDLVDWVGGYPFETARPQQLIDFYADRGLTLVGLKPSHGSGCNELVFANQTFAAIDQKSPAAQFAA